MPKGTSPKKKTQRTAETQSRADKVKARLAAEAAKRAAEEQEKFTERQTKASAREERLRAREKTSVETNDDDDAEEPAEAAQPDSGEHTIPPEDSADSTGGKGNVNPDGSEDVEGGKKAPEVAPAEATAEDADREKVSEPEEAAPPAVAEPTAVPPVVSAVEAAYQVDEAQLLKLGEPTLTESPQKRRTRDRLVKQMAITRALIAEERRQLPPRGDDHALEQKGLGEGTHNDDGSSSGEGTSAGPAANKDDIAERDEEERVRSSQWVAPSIEQRLARIETNIADNQKEMADIQEELSGESSKDSKEVLEEKLKHSKEWYELLRMEKKELLAEQQKQRRERKEEKAQPKRSDPPTGPPGLTNQDAGSGESGAGQESLTSEKGGSDPIVAALLARLENLELGQRAVRAENAHLQARLARSDKLNQTLKFLTEDRSVEEEFQRGRDQQYRDSLDRQHATLKAQQRRIAELQKEADKARLEEEQSTSSAGRAGRRTAPERGSRSAAEVAGEGPKVVDILERFHITADEWSKVTQFSATGDQQSGDPNRLGHRELGVTKEEAFLKDQMVVEMCMLDRDGIPSLMGVFAPTTLSPRAIHELKDATSAEYLAASQSLFRPDKQGYMLRLLRSDTTRSRFTADAFGGGERIADLDRTTPSMIHRLTKGGHDRDDSDSEDPSSGSSITKKGKLYLARYQSALAFVTHEMIEKVSELMRRLREVNDTTTIAALEKATAMLSVVRAMEDKFTPERMNKSSSMFFGMFRGVPDNLAQMQLLFMVLALRSKDRSHDKIRDLERQVRNLAQTRWLHLTSEQLITVVSTMIKLRDAFESAGELEVFWKSFRYVTDAVYDTCSTRSDENQFMAIRLLALVSSSSGAGRHSAKEAYFHFINMTGELRETLRRNDLRVAPNATTPAQHAFVGHTSGPPGGGRRQQHSGGRSQQAQRPSAQQGAHSRDEYSSRESRPRIARNSRPGDERSRGGYGGRGGAAGRSSGAYGGARPKPDYSKLCRAPHTCREVGLQYDKGSSDFARRMCKYKHARVTWKGTVTELMAFNRDQFQRHGKPVWDYGKEEKEYVASKGRSRADHETANAIEGVVCAEV